MTPPGARYSSTGYPKCHTRPKTNHIIRIWQHSLQKPPRFSLTCITRTKRLGKIGGDGSRTRVLVALNAARYMLSCR